MIASIAGWLVSKGVGEKVARPLIYAALVALAIAAFFGAKAAYDHHIISTNAAHVETKTQADNRKADAKAAEQRHGDDVRAAQESEQLNIILAKGPTNETADPGAYQRTALAFYECLRRQAAARQLGEPAPDC